MAWPRFEYAWDAIEFLAQAIVAASRLLVVFDEAGNEQIELGVFIMVEPDGARGPSWGRNSGFLGYVSECAVAVVVIENVTAVARYIKIDPTVAVIITRGCAHAKRAACDSSFVGNISKRSVVIVVIEGPLLTR